MTFQCQPSIEPGDLAMFLNVWICVLDFWADVCVGLSFIILSYIWNCRQPYTTKRGLSQRFENRWDIPKKHWDRVKIPIPAFFFPALQTVAV